MQLAAALGWAQTWGTGLFGSTLGYAMFFVLRNVPAANRSIQDLSVLASVIGGAATTALFPGNLFGYYCVGVGIGFWIYFAAAVLNRWIPTPTAGGNGFTAGLNKVAKGFIAGLMPLE
jgi:hypothetical protein